MHNLLNRRSFGLAVLAGLAAVVAGPVPAAEVPITIRTLGGRAWSLNDADDYVHRRLVIDRDGQRIETWMPLENRWSQIGRKVTLLKDQCGVLLGPQMTNDH